MSAAGRSNVCAIAFVLAFASACKNNQLAEEMTVKMVSPGSPDMMNSADGNVTLTFGVGWALPVGPAPGTPVRVAIRTLHNPPAPMELLGAIAYEITIDPPVTIMLPIGIQITRTDTTLSTNEEAAVAELGPVDRILDDSIDNGSAGSAKIEFPGTYGLFRRPNPCPGEPCGSDCSSDGGGPKSCNINRHCVPFAVSSCQPDAGGFLRDATTFDGPFPSFDTGQPPDGGTHCISPDGGFVLTEAGVPVIQETEPNGQANPQPLCADYDSTLNVWAALRADGGSDWYEVQIPDGFSFVEFSAVILDSPGGLSCFGLDTWTLTVLDDAMVMIGKNVAGTGCAVVNFSSMTMPGPLIPGLYYLVVSRPDPTGPDQTYFLQLQIFPDPASDGGFPPRPDAGMFFPDAQFPPGDGNFPTDAMFPTDATSPD
jgi:hypothetical protein